MQIKPISKSEFNKIDPARPRIVHNYPSGNPAGKGIARASRTSEPNAIAWMLTIWVSISIGILAKGQKQADKCYS